MTLHDNYTGHGDCASLIYTLSTLKKIYPLEHIFKNSSHGSVIKQHPLHEDISLLPYLPVIIAFTFLSIISSLEI
jgi:hypothetical protein